jgi:hypothetical protein
MQNAVMIYKYPGPYEFHGSTFDYRIIDYDDQAAVEASLKDGWRFTTDEAKKLIDPVVELAFPQAESGDPRTVAVVDAEIKAENALIREELENTPPTREELEAKAEELNISFNSKTKDSVLAEKIEEALTKVSV